MSTHQHNYTAQNSFQVKPECLKQTIADYFTARTPFNYISLQQKKQILPPPHDTPSMTATILMSAEINEL